MTSKTEREWAKPMPGWVGVGRRFQPEGTVCAKTTRQEELSGVGEQKGPRARMASSLRDAEDPGFYSQHIQCTEQF